MFELTADLSLSAFVFCLRFGWSEFRSALGVLASDPVPARRWSLALFHAALGAVRVVIGSGAVAVGLAYLLSSVGKGGASLEAVGAAGMTCGAGLVVTLLLSLAGLVSARLGGCRIWIAPAFDRQSPGEELQQRFGTQNELEFLLYLTALQTLCGTTAALMGLGRQIAPQADFWLLAAVAGAGGIGAALWMTRQFRRITAHAPQECWPEGHLDGR